MKAQKWNENWLYWEDKDSFALVWGIPKDAHKVTLPHDAMLEQRAYAESHNGGNTGFRDGGVYTYVKHLTVSEEQKGKILMLRFEGVYSNAMVYINGQLAGKNNFGYSVFDVPLNDLISYEAENEIRVQVRNSNMPNSRWYSGSGIYRDVYLLESEPVYLVPDGVQIVTEDATKEFATIRVSAELRNCQYTPQALNVVTVLRSYSRKEVARCKSVLTLLGQEERTVSQRIALENPMLWSDETPTLYTYEIALQNEDITLDSETGAFGIRTLALDAKRGLRVNGQPVKLRGACVHHDSGLLGAATFEDFHLRQARLLKEAGFNAVRSSHQPMAPAMLRACDQVGLYVMDEFSDMWDRCKSDLDYALSFQEQWEQDLTAMIRKDRNHPCVVLYSLGNEIPEIGTVHGAQVCAKLCQKVKELDPTRYTTAGINGVFACGDRMSEIMADILRDSDGSQGDSGGNVNDFMTVMDSRMDDIVIHPVVSERLEMAAASLDVVGYNYMTARYEQDKEQYPDRVIVGSETYPPQIARNWKIIAESPNVIGDFTWTGWDYIGEAGVGIPAYSWGDGGFGAQFPAQLAYCGDLDITGFRRPASYYRECVFGLRKEPYIAVQNPNHYGEPLIKTPWVISDSVSSWTWKSCEGKPVVVEVYAPGDEVELLVNDRSVGRKPSGAVTEYRTLFETVYEAGTVTAVLYENNKETARTELHTAGEPVRLAFSQEYLSEGELIFLQGNLLDNAGVVVANTDMKLNCEITGDAVLAGFGSGNPKPNYNYIDGIADTWNGRVLLILRKKACVGAVHVKVSTENGLSDELDIEF